MKVRIAIAVLCCTLVGSLALGGELDESMVSAKARWVAHLDAEGLLASQFGQHIAQEAEAGAHAEAIAQFTKAFGFDPMEDLRAITLWGEDYRPDAGVVIIEVKVDKSKLLALLVLNEDYETFKYGAYTLHGWTQEPEDRADTGVRWGTFYAEDLVIVTRDRKVLEGAIDTLDDEAATMAGQGGVHYLAAASKGTFLQVAGTDLPDDPQRSAVFRKLHSLSAELGEVDGSMFLTIASEAETEKAGQQLRDTLRGMLALIRMGLAVDEAREQPLAHWAPLVRVAAVGGEGATVTLSAEMATEEVIEMIKAREEAKEAAAGK